MQTPVRLSFEDYLNLDVAELASLPDGRHEFVDGELRLMAPESRRNRAIAMRLMFLLIGRGISDELMDPGGCEVAVPPLPDPKAPLNRYPDLVVLDPSHLDIEGRNTIYPDMAPPSLVVEVVSPGKSNRARDFEHKRLQYELREIPEYWIVDPDDRYLYQLRLVEGRYVESAHTESVTTALLEGAELSLAELWG